MKGQRYNVWKDSWQVRISPSSPYPEAHHKYCILPNIKHMLVTIYELIVKPAEEILS